MCLLQPAHQVARGGTEIESIFNGVLLGLLVWIVVLTS
jgi:hypothetical protein